MNDGMDFLVCSRQDFPYPFLELDEGGELAQIFSPRTSCFQTLDERLHFAMRSFKMGMGIALCVEELCPGGLDPTDGIRIAQAFERAGARFVIASGGTSDFLALKDRRMTRIQKDPNHAWLASACWLIGRVAVPVYAQGYFDEEPDPSLMDQAKVSGLSGLVRL
ncbi:MAG: hypothetical protein I8H75_03845 [Myxococcaceae bacterium]|nr:hypothetical protein [Myxococcaceae bacterium]MBH2006460.1 hypothetical protein [Myxococcaceae bacterium]